MFDFYALFNQMFRNVVDMQKWFVPRTHMNKFRHQQHLMWFFITINRTSHPQLYQAGVFILWDN